MKQAALVLVVVFIVAGLISCLVASALCGVFSCASAALSIPFLLLTYVLLCKLTPEILPVASVPTAPLRQPPRLT